MAIAVASVAYQATNTVASGSGTVVINKPTGLQVNEVMVAHIANGGGAGSAVALKSGWTNIAATTVTNHAQRVMYKIADASDVAASDFTFNVSGEGENQYKGGAIFRITGSALINFVDSTNNAGYAGTSSINVDAHVTPTNANSLLLMLTSFNASTSGDAFSNQAIATSNPSWTEHYDFGYTNGFCSMMGASAVRPETTSTGNTSFNTIYTPNAGTLVMVVINKAISVSPTLDVVSATSSTQDMTAIGGMTTTLDVIEATATPNDMEYAGQTKWSSQKKSTTGTWNAQNKS
jgi:hypothetical protein